MQAGPLEFPVTVNLISVDFTIYLSLRPSLKHLNIPRWKALCWYYRDWMLLERLGVSKEEQGWSDTWANLICTWSQVAMTSLGYFVVWVLELLGQPEMLWDLNGVVYGMIYNQLCYLGFDVVLHPRPPAPLHTFHHSPVHRTGLPHHHCPQPAQQSLPSGGVQCHTPHSAWFFKQVFPEVTLFHIHRLHRCLITHGNRLPISHIPLNLLAKVIDDPFSSLIQPTGLGSLDLFLFQLRLSGLPKTQVLVLLFLWTSCPLFSAPCRFLPDLKTWSSGRLCLCSFFIPTHNHLTVTLTSVVSNIDLRGIYGLSCLPSRSCF